MYMYSHFKHLGNNYIVFVLPP